MDETDLEERDTKNFPLVLQEFDEDDNGIKETPLKRKQYAILRDGQLFIQEGELQEDELYSTEEGADYTDTSFNNEINNGGKLKVNILEIQFTN